jgi:glycosyltransferase involved in cell wall biosynthesis
MAQVSVLLNVYNDEMFLDECIKSVLNQSFKDLELVIVNDGSTDRTLTIINKFKQQDSRITLLDLSKNVGRAKAINIALQHAGGQYIAKLDGDDYFFPEKIERQVEYLERHKDCFLVACGVDMVDEYSKRILTVKPLQSSQKIAERLLKKNTLFHSTIMFRNEGIKYREKFLYAQDYDLYLQILAKGKRIDALQDVLAGYRVQTSSVSFTKMGHQKLFANKARGMYHDFIEGRKGAYDEFDPQEILDIDLEHSSNQDILQSNIKLNFMIYDFSNVRRYAKRYFEHYGTINKVAVIYWASFLPPVIIKALIKYAPTSLLRKIND